MELLPTGERGEIVVRSSLVKARIGSVKAPKQVDVWPDLPRSRIGKVLKSDVKARLLNQAIQKGQQS